VLDRERMTQHRSAVLNAGLQSSLLTSQALLEIDKLGMRGLYCHGLVGAVFSFQIRARLGVGIVSIYCHLAHFSEDMLADLPLVLRVD